VVRLSVALGLLCMVGCASRMAAPTATPTGDEAPVTLRNLQVTTVDGHRAVLLRLSRQPTLVRHSSGRHPGQITVQAWGPAGDSDLPERTLAQVDPQIAQISVSRKEGALRVVFAFQSDEPPAYSVHEMADWIMIRLGVPES
jgi:hypothetical protein